MLKVFDKVNLKCIRLKTLIIPSSSTKRVLISVLWKDSSKTRHVGLFIVVPYKVLVIKNYQDPVTQKKQKDFELFYEFINDISIHRKPDAPSRSTGGHTPRSPGMIECSEINFIFIYLFLYSCSLTIALTPLLTSPLFPNLLFPNLLFRNYYVQCSPMSS